MSQHPVLQQRDIEQLRRYAFCYRESTAKIEAREAGVSASTMRKRLNRLTEGRLLARLTAWAIELEPITEPLFRWEPGDPTPDFGAIAYQTSNRWKHLAPKKTIIYTATRKLLAYFGLPPRPHIKTLHASHDLGCTEMYFYCEKAYPHLEFVGEEIFAPERGHGEGVEDAQLRDAEGVVAVAEHGGTYRKDRVIHFHEHVAERELPYLLF